jgi:hypothetical protein
MAGASTVLFTLARTSAVNLSAFDMRGSLVVRLVEGTLSTGLHEYVVDLSGMASGVYMVRLETEYGAAMRSVIVL